MSYTLTAFYYVILVIMVVTLISLPIVMIVGQLSAIAKFWLGTEYFGFEPTTDLGDLIVNRESLSHLKPPKRGFPTISARATYYEHTIAELEKVVESLKEPGRLGNELRRELVKQLDRLKREQTSFVTDAAWYPMKRRQISRSSGSVLQIPGRIVS